MGVTAMKRWLSACVVLAVLLSGLATLSVTTSIATAAPKSKQLVKGKNSKGVPSKPAKSNLPTQATKTEYIEMAKVDPALRESALKSAEKIDRLVEAKLKAANQKPNDLTTDSEFVRRAYLDITGTIPTAKQVQPFLAIRGESKRTLLIDQLLSRPGYASHFYNYWADILRLVDRANNNNYVRPYADWVKECLRENVAYDEMIYEMLTADGRIFETPAVGYVLRDQGMPLDNLNNTVRIFLGTRIGCAQCHDHPFDRWTQKEFYQLAAFTGGIEYRAEQKLLTKTNEKDVDKLFGPNTQENRQARNILRLNRPGIWDNAKKQLKYPENYQYSNAKSGDLVTPAVIFGSAPSAKIDPKNRREIFADWITDKNNPRFAMTIANRLWKRMLGVGLFEPEDDLRDDTKPTNPELMDYLVSEMRRLDFDLKEFQRIILFTKTYQRQATYGDRDPEKPYLFAGPVLRRMTAEQVWDSLLTLTMEDPEKVLRPDDEKYQEIVALEPGTTAEQVVDRAKKLDEYNKEENKAKQKRLYKGNELVRASELPQPLPGGHFLREFGQSDRSVISDSHTDGTVPQLLAMFNGPVTHMMLEEGSVIFNEVVAKKTPQEQVDMIFLSLLARHPTDAERVTALKEIREAKAAGYGNIIWALLNTREFLFVQ